jgi:ABC-2 type transport system permease protein
MTGGGRPIVLLVALREIRTRLQSRVFRVGTIVMIALIAVGIVGATISARGSGAAASVRVGFTGAATTLEPAFTAYIATLGTKVAVSDVPDAATGTAQVTAGTLDVLVTGPPTAPLAVVEDAVPSDVQMSLGVAVFEARLVAAGLTPAAVTAALAGTQVGVQSLAPAAPADPELAQKLVAAIAVAFLLYLTLNLYGSFVAQGVVEEKATRIVEVLLATVRPSQLLAGKIIGIGLVGLLQLSIVGAVTIVLIAVTGVLSLPALSPVAVLADLVWFVLGFLLYATADAAVAATISRQEEVSGALAPITIFLVAAYLLSFAVASDPGSTLSTALSILPPFAPILMSVRVATGDATAWQVGLAIALLVVSIAGLTWLAGRIYANSVLRIGKRVRLTAAMRGK